MPVLMVPSTSPKLGPHGPLATLPPTWPRSHESVRRSPPILFYYQSIYLYLKIGNKSVVCIFYNKLHLYYQSIHLSCCLYIFKTLSTSLLIRDAWHLQWLKERRHQEEQQWQSTTKNTTWEFGPAIHPNIYNFRITVSPQVSQERLPGLIVLPHLINNALHQVFLSRDWWLCWPWSGSCMEWFNFVDKNKNLQIWMLNLLEMLNRFDKCNVFTYKFLPQWILSKIGAKARLIHRQKIGRSL